MSYKKIVFISPSETTKIDESDSKISEGQTGKGKKNIFLWTICDIGRFIVLEAREHYLLPCKKLALEATNIKQAQICADLVAKVADLCL